MLEDLKSCRGVARDIRLEIDHKIYYENLNASNEIVVVISIFDLIFQ